MDPKNAQGFLEGLMFPLPAAINGDALTIESIRDVLPPHSGTLRGLRFAVCANTAAASGVDDRLSGCGVRTIGRW